MMEQLTRDEIIAKAESLDLTVPFAINPQQLAIVFSTDEGYQAFKAWITGQNLSYGYSNKHRTVNIWTFGVVAVTNAPEKKEETRA